MKSLPEWMAEECLHDADPDTRALVTKTTENEFVGGTL